jgi:MFS transporter, MHS family, proline/betaine transporter
MSISCIVMANVPTYAQVGVLAAWIVTACRVAQGLSSMGEIMGAEVYMTETIKVPTRYPAVALTGVSAAFGSFFALFIASLATTSGFNWRIAFWIGACIAVVGSIARVRLRESSVFLEEKRKRKDNVKIKEEELDKKSLLCFFLMEAAWPVWFYFIYIYCSSILRNDFYYTSEQVIHHNFIIGLFQTLGFLFLVFLSSKFHPFQILKAKRYILFPLIFLCPFILNNVSSPFQLLVFQIIFITFPITPVPSYPIMFCAFPVLKRFKCSLMMFALAHCVMHILNSFSLVILTDIFGNFGLWVSMISVTVGFYWSLEYFKKLENQKQNKPQVGTPLSTEHNQIKLAG